MRQVALVIETTGLEADARIIEIAAVEMQDGKLSGNTFNVMINPHHEISAGADNVNHLSNINVKRFPDFAAVADDFLKFIIDADVIIQYVPFIQPILNNELAIAGKPTLKESCHQVIDTWHLDRKLNSDKKHSLNDMALRYDLIDKEYKDRQGVRDARILGGVFSCLMAEAKTKKFKIEPPKEVNLVIDRFFQQPTKREPRLRTRQTHAVPRSKPY